MTHHSVFQIQYGKELFSRWFHIVDFEELHHYSIEPYLQVFYCIQIHHKLRIA